MWGLCWCVICMSVGLVSGQLMIPGKSRTLDGDYNSVNTDGSFEFGYSNRDRGSSYHLARGNSRKVVGGRFGSRDPATGTIKETVYTAGPRGFRAKGPNIHRKMDLDQRPRGPIGNKDDPYFDPSDDPSYSFGQKTRTYSKTETANSRGDVKGHYSFVDDIGERHDVAYVAGRDTGFHVTSAYPDHPSAAGSLYFRAPLVRGEPRQRGRTAIQRSTDGSYRFISAGPDQRRAESSDAHGNVRGSYSFLDDKGVQRTVHYIAGPGIGYRIVKNSQDPNIPPYFPTIPSAYDPDFNAVSAPSYVGPSSDGAEDIFKGPDATAASGHVKPPSFSHPGDKDRPDKKPLGGGQGIDDSKEDHDNGYVDRPDDPGEYGGEFRPTMRPKPVRPTKRPLSGRPTYKPSPNKNPRPTYIPNAIGPVSKPSGGQSSVDSQEEVDSSKDKEKPVSSEPGYGIGFSVAHSKPGTTIIKNVGEDYFGVPPGVAVRAHVQSIDLYPFGSKPVSPSEAIEKKA